MSTPQDRHDDAALAAEYVLRLLDAEAAQAFEARLLAEPALRDAVRYWEAEFATLAEDLPDTPPPPGVRANLLAALDPAPPPVRRFWGWLALPGLAVLALAVFVLLGPMLRDPAFDPRLHATLISADGAVHIEAGYAPDGNLFKVIPEQGTPATGRDFELWVIGPAASAPISLGVIPSDQISLFEITPQIAALIDGGTLAVSDEPAGGSPTGAPTGAILAAGAFFDADLFQAR